MNEATVNSQDRYLRALQAYQQREYRQAEAQVSALLRERPELVNGWRLRADIQYALGQLDTCIEYLESALAVAEAASKPWVSASLHLVKILVASGQQRRALRALDIIDFSCVDHIEPLSQAAYHYSLCGGYAASLLLYEKALLLQPNNTQLLFNCAAANRAMGKLARAEQLYNRLIAQNPVDAEAYKNRSDLRRQTRAANHVLELEQVLKGRPLDTGGESQLCFALAKEYEDLEEYAKSMAMLERACKLRRSIIRYAPETDLEKIDEIMRVFDRDKILNAMAKSSEPAQGREIVFVLGMPRTGTTLVDRILCANGQVVSAGEPGIFSRLLTEMIEEIARENSGETVPGNKGLVEIAAGIDFEQLGRNYLQEIKGRVSREGSELILDKNPMNFLYVGLIRLALPGAKIVHLCRDAMDTCYAIYKTQFRNAYPFSYDQQELARYFLKYRALMAHWQTVVGDGVLDVHYERLVKDFARETQQLYAFCGLHWSASVADFHMNTRLGTATASASQVRQPVYATSVGKWKNVEKALQPMRQVLTQAGFV
ncbi:tetratricopeptide repeat-containing sulfotransferase family protein [Microbulbifer pacificus]|uniref:Sulfotransferase n=1 Tax=Microbulbifer pacificus TaxID=407164 RepID=A0AAU0N2A4_9GAMM|nr:sulfotransferase [Microbulbifer pacificus]WOX07092.1 sulfotransferase [Microbulbifer pacificus]